MGNAPNGIPTMRVEVVVEDEIRQNDRVRFVAGRGTAEGRVAGIDGETCQIVTDAGKLIHRRLACVHKVHPEPVDEPDPGDPNRP